MFLDRGANGARGFSPQRTGPAIKPLRTVLCTQYCKHATQRGRLHRRERGDLASLQQAMFCTIKEKVASRYILYIVRTVLYTFITGPTSNSVEKGGGTACTRAYCVRTMA